MALSAVAPLLQVAEAFSVELVYSKGSECSTSKSHVLNRWKINGTANECLEYNIPGAQSVKAKNCHPDPDDNFCHCLLFSGTGGTKCSGDVAVVQNDRTGTRTGACVSPPWEPEWVICSSSP
ncbi:hypothetical protein L208DRAFT_1406709 [Tricholoma matsutake]|nr:hypothetical protein L208DRAFT_1406709 [Tricholoma matsutake 945]